MRLWVAAVGLVSACQPGTLEVQTVPLARVEVVASDGAAKVEESDEDGLAVVSVRAGDAVRATDTLRSDILVHHVALDVRPGGLLFLGADPVGGVDQAGVLTLVVRTPWPDDAAGQWVGLIECAGAFPDGEDWLVDLDACRGEATPVAMALDGLGRPVSFLSLAAEPAAGLAGEVRVLEGPWRTDWSVLRLDVEGASTGGVMAEHTIGAWTAYEVHPGAPFSVAFRIPPEVTLAGTLRVLGLDEDLVWASRARSGDRVAIDFSDAPWFGEGHVGEELAVEGARTVWLEALAVGEVTESWQLRGPVPSTLPADWSLDVAAEDGGYLTLRASDIRYGEVRASGSTARGHWHRGVALR